MRSIKKSPAPLAGGNRAGIVKPYAADHMTPATRLQQSQADQLRDLAIAVRRLGNGYRQDPESIAMEKDRVSKELVALARRLEEARP